MRIIYGFLKPTIEAEKLEERGISNTKRENLVETDNFVCLGSMISKGEADRDVEHRINKSTPTFNTQ